MSDGTTKRIALWAAWALALTALAPLAVVAADMAPSAIAEKGIKTEFAKLRQVTSKRAHEMMGDVNLAALALDMDLPNEALSHVKKAESIADILWKNAPELSSQTRLKYGKLSYSVEDEIRQYYVPVVDDVFLLSDYQTTHHMLGKDEVDEIDAGIVEVTISADLREVKKALEAVEKKLAAKDYEGARSALGGVFTNSITDEAVVTDPIWAVHDNLSLAWNLIREERYDSASFALEHAKARLGVLETNRGHAGATGRQFKTMHDEITKLQTELRKQHPTLPQKLGDRFSSWMETVSSWHLDRAGPEPTGY